MFSNVFLKIQNLYCVKDIALTKTITVVDRQFITAHGNELNLYTHICHYSSNFGLLVLINDTDISGYYGCHGYHRNLW